MGYVCSALTCSLPCRILPKASSQPYQKGTACRERGISLSEARRAGKKVPK
jgi:hypothetical protein